MGSLLHHRKLFPIPELSTNITLSVLSPPEHHKKVQHISPFVVIVVGILAGCFLLVSYYAIIVKYCTNMRSSRRPQQQQQPQNDENSDAHEDFLEENHSPVLDHPIWYIHTVGLPQTVIDSIAVFKFRKGEGLLEGTDCSVCLSEFEDEETLRLLPKCSHAFHVSCIDTWLRSHTNCPSCRAPIVALPVVPEVNSGGSDSAEESEVENAENGGGLGDEGVGDLSVGDQDETEEQDRVSGIGVSKKNLLSPLEISESEFRVLSDLSDTHRLGQDRRLQVRRSASMDFNPASVFCFSVGNSFPEQDDEASASLPLEKGKKDNPSPGIGRLIGSCSSKGRLFPRSPAFMKRSVSTGGKLWSSKSSKNQSSVLPL